jgi:hypothetical protein
MWRQAISLATGYDDPLIIIGGPTGMLYAIHTDKTHKEVLEIFKERETANEDSIPVVIWNAQHGGFNFGMPNEVYDPIAQTIKEQTGIDISRENKEPEVKKETCTLQLDDLLDKISGEGLDSLSDPELARLEFLTKA